MDATGDLSGILATLEESLCSDSDIEFVVAFGSQISGERRPASDLDIAVKFSGELSAHERFRKQCFLSGDLQHEGSPFIDVADIERLPVDVAHDAVHGALLCGDEEKFDQFKTNVEGAFEEQRDAIHRHQRDVIERIADEGLRG